MKILSPLIATLALSDPIHASPLTALKDIDYRYFVAGGTCAAISHGITTPVDVVKTKIQAQPTKYDQGLIKALLKVVQEEGSSTLTAGLGPTVVGYGMEGAMKFGVYEVMKPILASSLGGDNTAVAYLLASVLAGAVAALLLCPMESTRIRIVTDPAFADKGLLTGLPLLVQQQGLLSTFNGLWAMLAKQVPYTFGKQVSFDVFAGLLYASLYDLLPEQVGKWIVSVVAAFLASLVACLLSQPGDVLLTATYKDPNGADQNFSQIARSIYASGDLGPFFTGTVARIVHVGMIITSQLVIYDVVKQMLGLPATGSH